MKIYVGCSLIHAPEEFREMVEKLKEELRKQYDILEFVGLGIGSPKDVYDRDIHTCMVQCDIFVAICDFPSLGLGYELGVAVENLQKPTLALAHEDTKVSRLILGINAPHYIFMRYKHIKDIPLCINDFGESFERAR